MAQADQGLKPAVRVVPLLKKWNKMGLLSGSRNAEATGDFSYSSMGYMEARARCQRVEGTVAGEERERASVVREGRTGQWLKVKMGSRLLAPRDEPQRRGHSENGCDPGMRTSCSKVQDVSRGTGGVEPGPRLQVCIGAFLLD